MRVVVLALACGGCIPSVPFVVGETAEVLKAREVSAAVYGGGGAFTGTGSSGSNCCGGAMARVRVGVGHAQEVGIDGGAYMSGTPGHGSIWGSGKLAWKLQLGTHLAFVAGAGLTFIDRTVGLGGDAGIIASTKPLLSTRLQLYSALRLTMIAETHGDVADGGGVLAGGVAWNASRNWRVAAEVGVAGAGEHDVPGMGLAPHTNGYFGAYGAALVSYAWRR